MSIKSYYGGGSDKSGVLIEKQREPTIIKHKKKFKKIEHIDTLSDYVRKNLKDVDKRNKEYR